MRKKNSLVSYMYLIQIFDLRSSALSQPRSPKWLELLKFFERKKRKTTYQVTPIIAESETFFDLAELQLFNLSYRIFFSKQFFKILKKIEKKKFFLKILDL